MSTSTNAYSCFCRYSLDWMGLTWAETRFFFIYGGLGNSRPFFFFFLAIFVCIQAMFFPVGRGLDQSKREKHNLKINVSAVLRLTAWSSATLSNSGWFYFTLNDRNLNPGRFFLKKWFYNGFCVLFSEEKDVGFECGFTMCFLLVFMILPPLQHLKKNQTPHTHRDSLRSETQLSLHLPHAVHVDRNGLGREKERESSSSPGQMCAGCHPGQWDGHPSSCWKYHRLFDNKCSGICCFNVPSKKDISNNTASQNTCWGFGHAWKSSISSISFSSLVFLGSVSSRVHRPRLTSLSCEM